MSAKPLWYRWARVYFAGSCIIGTGVLCFIYTTPTDEQLIASFSPEIREDYEKNKAYRQREQQELMEIVKKTSQSDEPVWKTGPIGSPLEKEQRNLNQQLIDYNQFEKKRAEEYQREQIDKAQEELLEVEKLAAQAKKGYWWNPFSSK
ncbi:predicted protein [Scheffersomyces stipitis CBS 6054]|uniref:Assembly factor CBP4 n=1 Tax=Scheffersomyces stipitis (strain ATCC 58785 / CBS 6054 / NBRC 10063 / NRRL Y-11545) TaxID=322104 RepID=CBP4_PICST|nr:predicted protein [Scheffersomyces stipitis CBS 6054]A3LQD9.1 RecName: Full=Assembly factor CBP4; AltName: Full=Cytochrome b mRNA-processing protein 4 [Scheffersomyces stipitis CBS 6054]ABN65190.1 predicted protein [Scheffersomyces stipitis CBS 6054]KAG2735972.1 hypothetical protein G9P44_000062 [Scheffersomyces stipitis]